MDQLKEVQYLEETVWKEPSIPLHQTFTGLNNGGIILGAYDEDRMIGFLYSFPGFDGKNAYLCSHMLGILPEYRNAGIEKKMKIEQAILAKEMGYEMITWTFDPLQSENAHFNLHKLGAIGTDFKANTYANFNDEFSKSIHSDRIQIMWDIRERCQVKEPVHLDETKILLHMNSDTAPVITENYYQHYHKQNDVWFVAIPADYQAIKQRDSALANNWREATKTILKRIFDDGYQANDFIITGYDYNLYVFTK